MEEWYPVLVMVSPHGCSCLAELERQFNGTNEWTVRQY